jgi:hypothetical protein
MEATVDAFVERAKLPAEVEVLQWTRAQRVWEWPRVTLAGIDGRQPYAPAKRKEGDPLTLKEG